MFSEHLKYVKYKKINLDGTFFDVYWYFSTFFGMKNVSHNTSLLSIKAYFLMRSN